MLKVSHDGGEGNWISSTARFYSEGICILDIEDCASSYSKGETVVITAVYEISEVINYPMTNDVDYILDEI